MTTKTIFRESGKGRVKVKPEFLADILALLGVQLQAAQDAIDRAESQTAPELRKQSMGTVKYYKAMSSGILGVMKRAGSGIDKAKLALARITVQDVLTILTNMPDGSTIPQPTGNGDVTGGPEARGDTCEGAGDTLGDEGRGTGHHDDPTTGTSVPPRDKGTPRTELAGQTPRPGHDRRHGKGTRKRKADH